MAKTDEGNWQAPYWQEPVREAKLELAKHEDGPLINARREGFMQKRAGKSSIRWNVRYFEIKEGTLAWWRPRFRDQLFQPSAPTCALKEPRPKPVRRLDLTQLRSVTKTKVKFPYSTRILLRFRDSYTDYELELRAEKENDLIQWFKIFIRFTMETYEVENDEDVQALPAALPADPGSASETDHP